MRRSSKLLAFVITGTLSLGFLVAPASAGPAAPATTPIAAAAPALGPVNIATGKATKTKSKVKVTLTTKDLKNKKGTVSNKEFIKLKVTTPQPITDTYGDVIPVRWYASIKTSGKGSCDGFYQASGTVDGSGTFTVPVKFKSKKVNSHLYYYTGSGKCKVTADVTAYRYTIDTKHSIYENIKVSANVFIRDKAKVTTSAPKTVKKNKSFTVSGKATYVAADKKRFYKSTAIKKGTKVQVQFQKNGKGPWKTVKTVKVGKSGKYAAKIKLKTKGKVRVVVPKSNSRLQAVSAKKSITVKK